LFVFCSPIITVWKGRFTEPLNRNAVSFRFQSSFINKKNVKKAAESNSSAFVKTLKMDDKENEMFIDEAIENYLAETNISGRIPGTK